jgi:hypothetical protein
MEIIWLRHVADQKPIPADLLGLLGEPFDKSH